MKILCRNQKLVLIGLLTLLCMASLTTAAERDMVQFQGVVMTVNLKKQTLVVNERVCVWNQQTLIRDERGVAIDMDQIKAKTWVYVEGVQEKGQRHLLAKAIYLLPKYIDGKEKSFYPFIK